MKAKMTLNMFAGMAALTVWSMPANAAGRYDGPATDVNLINNPPAKYAECDKYLNDTNAKRFAACEFGRDEAARMAERYAGGNGRIEGFLRGYAWGLHKSANLNKDDANEMARGSSSAEGMGQFQAGIDAGIREGQKQGTSQGRSDAIERFVSIVNTGRNPDPSVRVPGTNFRGEDNAYQKYVGQVPTVQQIAKTEMNLGELPVYHDRDAVFLGDVQPVSFWDLIFDDGTYKFEKTRWFDQNLAMSSWKKFPIDTKPKYDQLNIGAPIDPVTGTPVNLQAVFEEAFKNSYGWYVSYHYSRQFHTNLDTGFVTGEQAGTQLGKRIAFYTGLEQGFNRKFKESSAASFRNAFVGTYTNVFNGTFTDYNSNPKLSLSFEGVIGEVNDGIIQPGEAIAAKFTIRNVGGQGSQLTASLSGSVQEATSQSFQIPRLAAQTFTTGLIAKIDPRLRPRDTANLVLRVNDMSDDLHQTVLRMIQLANSNYRMDVSQGNGTVTAAISNVATVRTPGLVTATLRINGTEITTQQLGSLEAGQTVEVVLPFANLDPIALMDGQYHAEVISAMNGHASDIAGLDLTPADREAELVKYYNQLVNDRGVVPAGVSRSDRTADVRAKIVAINDQEMRAMKDGDSNAFKKNPGSTALGKIVSAKKGEVQSAKATEEYHSLGAQLWGKRKLFGKFLWIRSPKRKAYENLVKQLSKSGKYK